MRNLIKEPLVELLGPLGIGPEGHRKQSPTPKKKNTHILSSSDGEISATSKKLNSAKKSACNSSREQKMFLWNCHCSYCWENVLKKWMHVYCVMMIFILIYKWVQVNWIFPSIIPTGYGPSNAQSNSYRLIVLIQWKVTKKKPELNTIFAKSN